MNRDPPTVTRGSITSASRVPVPASNRESRSTLRSRKLQSPRRDGQGRRLSLRTIKALLKSGDTMSIRAGHRPGRRWCWAAGRPRWGQDLDGLPQPVAADVVAQGAEFVVQVA